MAMKTTVALMLILCIVIPFISPSVSAYIATTHTHICHEDKHEDDCVGLKECCKICKSIDNVKNRPLYYSVANGLLTTSSPNLSILHIDYEFQHIHISLISLKVRLNN